MKPKYRNKRLAVILFVGLPLIVAGALTLRALDESVSFFMTPTELASSTEIPTQTIRLGGLVVDESVVRGEGIRTTFQVTDGGAAITVHFDGILPDLFREGQGVIVEGLALADDEFDANLVLAKHDENYVPKELQHIAKKDGAL